MRPGARRNTQSGFVVSAELMLIALILLVGSIAGWAKLRDQSVAEILDSISALEAFNLGAVNALQPLGTRWIVGGAVVDPPATGPITATATTSGASVGTIQGAYVQPAGVATTAAGAENEDVIP
jgi:hypothetical protein